ncbi:hypothetical protein NEMBOFW57_003236 [Staphylotrichum longicolle]|uniref:Uncharacterized protein n=1 Tax=Staphylotrichum longicolle TaxID=669026 RepID=A0AAD4I4E8_9PEZI|nr:hypothetical protein NEMBOFW57_003236 [Staphylotrichum longicolle]
MATNGLHSDHPSNLAERQTAPPRGESPGQLGARATYGRDQTQSTRRRLSTIRRLERNAEIFNPDLTKPVNIRRSTLNSIHISAIQRRLEHLRIVLQTSEFPPEHANIEAAIAGYESEAIPYSDSYTLIWAGRIVDRCPDFDSFTLDRSARLDRYEVEYGPGWLWYEPPLSGGGGTIRGPTIVVKKGICLENMPSWRHGTENMGHYRVNMGFRRRKANVSRGKLSPFAQHSSSNDAYGAHMPKKRRRSATATTPRTPRTPKTPNTPRIPSMPQPNTSQPGTTFPDPDGPRIYWDTLLDSGATLPCLYENDMSKLGISRSTYAAQSSRSVATADAVITSRVYELDVCVAAGSAPHRLPQRPMPLRTRAAAAAAAATPNSPAAAGSSPRTKRKHPPQQQDDEHDDEPTSMRCTIPVIAFAGSSNDLPDTTTTSTTNSSTGPKPSDHAPDRLSGILPFHVCYTSSAPGAFKMWMGEDRRDVLGAGRLPGNMRYGEILGGEEGDDVDDHDEKAAMSPGNATTAKGTTRGGRGRGWPSRDLRTPERVIFEHDFPDGTGRVLRDEDGKGGNVIVCGPRGVDFDRLDATAQDVDVWRVDRKRQPRRRSEVRKAARN